MPLTPPRLLTRCLLVTALLAGGTAAVAAPDESADPVLRLLAEKGLLPNTAAPVESPLVRQVREIHPDMKVIFISGYTEDAFRQRLDSDSEIHFLPKPFSLKQLAGKVKEVISGEMV